ncbi:MAG: acetate kinase [Spirochaetaceae bacterium]|nr:acetate kinase [Spirochaetaceae bacterium]|tara:strand:+ start:34372 stop:35589 length:1218 start_codon:yes stop_codon:yes gene_type:complete
MSKEILVCNSGSSSLKLDVFQSGEYLSYLASASVDRIGQMQGAESELEVKIKDRETHTERSRFEDHRSALLRISELLEKEGVFSQGNRFAVGHRVVHGGPDITDPVIIDDSIESIIDRCSIYAPLHNPANLNGIRVARELFDCPQVGVFDTAFHAKMPAPARTYAIPRDIAQRHGIQRYGFHGTSHGYVAEVAARNLNRALSDVNLITLHLGNGASVCAIKDGISIDTSMGFTPLEGLVMGTRCGDLDPAIVAYLQEKEKLIFQEVDTLLNRQSGLLGLGGASDMRDLLDKESKGDQNAALAIDTFCYRARKYIGAYFAAIGGQVDAIVFTAGIGENSSAIRRRIMDGLFEDRIYFDEDANEQKLESQQGNLLTKEQSPVAVYAIPTDEEWMIARLARDLLAKEG